MSGIVVWWLSLRPCSRVSGIGKIPHPLCALHISSPSCDSSDDSVDNLPRSHSAVGATTLYRIMLSPLDLFSLSSQPCHRDIVRLGSSVGWIYWLCFHPSNQESHGNITCQRRTVHVCGSVYFFIARISEFRYSLAMDHSSVQESCSG